MADGLKHYLTHGERVLGWLDQYSAAFIASLSQVQTIAGLSGAVGEIGVHMGRLFILLKLTAPDEPAFAIDVFGNQNLNVDELGGGDRHRFLENVREWTGNADIEVFQASSLDVTPEQIVGAVGPCRLVSIDGGHTEECAYGDLRLVELVLLPGGVAILDDFFNQSWPGVATGAARYFLDRATALRPFAITPNKVYLARPEHHEFYRSAMHRIQGHFFEKTSEMFGSEVGLFGCEPKKFQSETGAALLMVKAPPDLMPNGDSAE